MPGQESHGFLGYLLKVERLKRSRFYCFSRMCWEPTIKTWGFVWKSWKQLLNVNFLRDYTIMVIFQRQSIRSTYISCVCIYIYIASCSRRPLQTWTKSLGSFQSNLSDFWPRLCVRSWRPPRPSLHHNQQPPHAPPPTFQVPWARRARRCLRWRLEFGDGVHQGLRGGEGGGWGCNWYIYIYVCMYVYTPWKAFRPFKNWWVPKIGWWWFQLTYLIRIRQVPGPPTGLKKVKLDLQGWTQMGPFLFCLEVEGPWRLEGPTNLQNRGSTFTGSRYVYVYIYDVYIFIYIYVYMYIYIYVNIYIYVYLYIYMYIYIYICKFLYMYIFIYVYIHM